MLRGLDLGRRRAGKARGLLGSTVAFASSSWADSAFAGGADGAGGGAGAACAVARRDYATKNICAHRYATETIHEYLHGIPGILALKYFPNLLEHRDIINLACDGLVRALYFFEASCEHGPFLSDQDHFMAFNKIFRFYHI